MRSPIWHLLAAVVAAPLLGAGLGACAIHRDDSASGYSLVVRQGDRVLTDFGLARLRELPQVEIATPQSHGSQVQQGPTVRSVLDAAGATDVVEVRVEGRDPAQTLSVAELTDQVVLSVTKRDTLKLAGANLDRDRWVRDVTTLVINP